MYDISNMKANYKFADTVFEIESCFDYFGKFAKEYVVDEEASIKLSSSKEQVESWKESHSDCEGFSLDYIAILVIHSLVASELAKENKFIIHGSSIYVDDPSNGYIFVAPSGTGKSTHVRLLKKMYGNRINYVNDDKPFISITKDGFELYGSPWNGKEHLGNNLKAQLKGVFVVSRSNTNKVSKLSPKETIKHLIKQLHIPLGIEETANATNALIKLCESLPVYLLEVNMNDDAARVSFDIMSKGDK